MKYFFPVDTEANFKAAFDDYVAFPGSIPLRFVKPAMRLAQIDYIKPILGDAYYTELLEETNPNNITKEVLEAIQDPLAHLTVINALPHLNVKVSQGGTTQNNTLNETPAQWWQIRDQKIELERNANNALSRLLKFLDENSEEPELYTYRNSPAFKNNNRNFCNSYETANQIDPNISSYFVFQRMRSAMTRVDENVLKLTLGESLYNHIYDTYLDRILDNKYSILLKLIQRAEITLAFAESAMDSVIAWTPEYGMHVPLINEVATGRRTSQITISEREKLTRVYEARSREAISAIKKNLEENAAQYTEYEPPTIPQQEYVTTKCRGGIYLGIGLNPER